MAVVVHGRNALHIKPGQDPTQTLKNLLAVRTKATSALTESASRLYISIEEIEEAQDPDALMP